MSELGNFLRDDLKKAEESFEHIKNVMEDKLHYSIIREDAVLINHIETIDSFLSYWNTHSKKLEEIANDKELEKAKQDYVNGQVEASYGTEYGGELGWNVFMEEVKGLSRQEFIDYIVNTNGLDEEEVIDNYFNEDKANEH